MSLRLLNKSNFSSMIITIAIAFILFYVVCYSVQKLKLDESKSLTMLREKFDTSGLIDPNDLTSEKASACAQQMLIALEQADRFEKQDREVYEKELAPWEAARDVAQAKFDESPKMWATECKADPKSCGDVKQYFTVRGGNITYHVLPWAHSPGASMNECLQLCLGNGNCDMVTHSPDGGCYLQRLNRGGPHKAAFKMDDGTFRDFESSSVFGNQYATIPGQTFEGCKKLCEDDASCNMVTFTPGWDAAVKLSDICYKQAAVRSDGFQLGMKRGSVKRDANQRGLPDNHPYIEYTAGVKPDFKDYRRQIDISPVCQDCSQAQSKTDIGSSKDINIDQIQRCIIELETGKNTSPSTSNGNDTTSSTPPSPPSPPPPPSTTPPPPSPPSSGTGSNNTALFIGLGVTGFVIAIIASIMIVLLSRR